MERTGELSPSKISICLLLLFKRKRMEEFSYLPVTNFGLYPVGILFLTSILLGLENQKTKPLPFRTGFCFRCLLRAVTTATVWDMSFYPGFSLGLFFHHFCIIPLVYVARGKCVQTCGRIQRNKLLFFSYCLPSLYGRDYPFSLSMRYRPDKLLC